MIENNGAGQGTFPHRGYAKLRGAVRQARRPKVIRNCGVRLAPNDPVISKRIRSRLYGDSYERPEVAILGTTLTETDVVMEIGAGIGFVASFAATRIGGERVHAYEANPQLIPLIRRNFELNDIEPYLHHGILKADPHSGSCPFYLAEDFWASSIIDTQTSVDTIAVPVLDFMAELRRIEPTYLVVDIEGGEVALLDTNDFHNVRRILIELHPELIGEAAALTQILQ